MGFRMAITTGDDVSHANAYFKVVHIHEYDHTNKRCAFGLAAWKDKTARDAAKAQLVGISQPLSFFVQGETFDTWFADSVLAVEGKTLLKQCYLYARSLAEYSGATDVDPDQE